MKRIRSLLLLTFLLAGCTSSRMSPTRTPFSCTQAGTVQILEVSGFGEIGLYLPPCYESQSKYPVLYLLPGFGGTHMEWLDTGVAAVTDQSIQNGEIPPFLIVTTDDTYETIQAEDIVTALIPYIDSHYPTIPDRLHRAIAGGSLGGGSAYLLTFAHPDVFGSTGIFGNGLVAGREAEDEAALAAMPNNLKPRIFLNSGEQDTYMLQQAKALIPLLDKYGIEHAEIFSTGGHAGNYWLSNFPVFFRWLAEVWA